MTTESGMKLSNLPQLCSPRFSLFETPRACSFCAFVSKVIFISPAFGLFRVSICGSQLAVRVVRWGFVIGAKTSDDLCSGLAARKFPSIIKRANWIVDDTKLPQRTRNFNIFMQCSLKMNSKIKVDLNICRKLLMLNGKSSACNSSTQHPPPLPIHSLSSKSGSLFNCQNFLSGTINGQRLYSPDMSFVWMFA